MRRKAARAGPPFWAGQCPSGHRLSIDTDFPLLRRPGVSRGAELDLRFPEGGLCEALSISVGDSGGERQSIGEAVEKGTRDFDKLVGGW
jgi:hypothetical protein